MFNSHLSTEAIADTIPEDLEKYRAFIVRAHHAITVFGQAQEQSLMARQAERQAEIEVVRTSFELDEARKVYEQALIQAIKGHRI